MKTYAAVFELLTVLSAISTRDSRVPAKLLVKGISGKHVQLVSANSKGASKFVSYQKYLRLLCLYHDVHVALRRDLELSGRLALNVTIIN